MLLTALYQMISMKIFALLLSLFYAANGAAAAPSTAAPIKSEQANMSFVAIADSQVSTYLFSRYKTFVSAAQDIVNNAGSFDALCFVAISPRTVSPRNSSLSMTALRMRIAASSPSRATTTSGSGAISSRASASRTLPMRSTATRQWKDALYSGRQRI